MAETSGSAPGSATVEVESQALQALEMKERGWRIRVAKADFFQKILISIVGACIAAVFYLYQSNQTQSRYYSDLQAQRERADADLRAKMFDTLFQAYFKNKFEAAQRADASDIDPRVRAATLLQNLGQEITLSDLLARNFETVDVRPLFEDIDNRLSRLLAESPQGRAPPAQELQAFRQLEQLRRVAYGATSRQTELLQANANAKVQQVRVEQCEFGEAEQPVIVPDKLPPLPGNVVGIIRRVDDSSVTIDLSIPTSEAVVPVTQAGAIVEPDQPRVVPITVTFYDMPSLENVRLPDGRRIALTLTRARSTLSCERFALEMDESARLDCDELTDDSHTRGGRCIRAEVTLTLIPKLYIGARDRPYLSDLSSRGGSGSLLDLFKRPAAVP